MTQFGIAITADGEVGEAPAPAVLTLAEIVDELAEFVNYRELLKKYIDHVGEEEGVTFLHSRPAGRFTDEEWAELQVLDAESAA
jgi:hypothetical protein